MYVHSWQLCTDFSCSPWQSCPLTSQWCLCKKPVLAHSKIIYSKKVDFQINVLIIFMFPCELLLTLSLSSFSISVSTTFCPSFTGCYEYESVMNSLLLNPVMCSLLPFSGLTVLYTFPLSVVHQLSHGTRLDTVFVNIFILNFPVPVSNQASHLLGLYEII